MPILKKEDTVIAVPAKVQRANEVRENANRAVRMLLRSVRQGMRAIWDSKNPANVIGELGTDAAAALDLHAAIVDFLELRLDGTDYQESLDSLLARAAEIPAYTANPDGTVTLD